MHAMRELRTGGVRMRAQMPGGLHPHASDDLASMERRVESENDPYEANSIL